MLKRFFNTDSFKLIISIIFLIVIISTSLYTKSFYPDRDVTIFFDRLCYIFGTKMISLFTLPFLSLLITMSLITIYDKCNYYFIRFKNKDKYHKYFIKTLLTLNCIVFLILTLSIILSQIIFRDNSFVISYYHITNDYVVSNLLFAVWLIIKQFLITCIYVIFDYFLIRIFNKKIVIILNVIFVGSLLILNQYNNGIFLLHNLILVRPFARFLDEVILFFINWILCVLILYFYYDAYGKKARVIQE